MQEYLYGSNKNKPEDAKCPCQDKSVRTNIRWEWDSYDVDPETCNRDN